MTGSKGRREYGDGALFYFNGRLEQFNVSGETAVTVMDLLNKSIDNQGKPRAATLTPAEAILASTNDYTARTQTAGGVDAAIRAATEGYLPGVLLPGEQAPQAGGFLPDYLKAFSGQKIDANGNLAVEEGKALLRFLGVLPQDQANQGAQTFLDVMGQSTRTTNALGGPGATFAQRASSATSPP